MNIIFENQFFILLGALAVLAGLGFWRIQELRKKIGTLYGGKEGADLKENFLARLLRMEAKHEEIEPRMARLESVAELSIHKVGFLRYNPFDDTGGDNSFVLALLDRNDNGVLISSLYMRDGMRVYAKKIERGTAPYALSQEEKQALAHALGGKR